MSHSTYEKECLHLSWQHAFIPENWCRPLTFLKQWYRNTKRKNRPYFWWRKYWNLKCHPKVTIFLWQLLHEKPSTKGDQTCSVNGGKVKTSNLSWNALRIPFAKMVIHGTLWAISGNFQVKCGYGMFTSPKKKEQNSVPSSPYNPAAALQQIGRSRFVRQNEHWKRRILVGMKIWM